MVIGGTCIVALFMQVGTVTRDSLAAEIIAFTYIFPIGPISCVIIL
jgi:hypothetical protein